MYKTAYNVMISIDKAYSCKDGHALVIGNRWIVSCPTVDAVISRTTPVSGGLPTLSPAVTIELNNSIYKLGNFIDGEINVYVRIMYLCNCIDNKFLCTRMLNKFNVNTVVIYVHMYVRSYECMYASCYVHLRLMLHFGEYILTCM